MSLPENTKNIWIGSSHKAVDERGRDSWWCTPDACEVGDLLVMYQKGVGVKRVEQIREIRAVAQSETACRDRRMKTVNTTLVMDLEKPISYHDFLSDRTLRDLPSVRRRFQGTCLRVPPGMWPALKQILEQHATQSATSP